MVDVVEEWPGVTTFHATLTGGHITATRPKHFFRDDGSMPEVVSLAIARPKGFENLAKDEWASLVTERVRAREADHRQRRALAGITVLGHERVLEQDPFECPARQAPRFRMSPRVAAMNKWARIEALLRNRGFIEKYRDALPPQVWPTFTLRGVPPSGKRGVRWACSLLSRPRNHEGEATLTARP